MSNYSNGKEYPDLMVQYATDTGMVHSNNEDYGGYFIPTDYNMKFQYGCLFAVSDGVGGSKAGEVASSEAVNVLLQEYYFGKHTERVPDRFKAAFHVTSLHVNNLARQNGSCNNMMCTLTALLVRDNKFHISHVGDSKAFLLRNGELIQLTKDHSVVGKLVRTGLISKEEAKVHPDRHVILRSLGDRTILPPDFYSGNLKPGDIFFLTTDGILEHLEEEEVREFLMEEKDLKNSAEGLIRIANERGGEDNLTAMIISNGK